MVTYFSKYEESDITLPVVFYQVVLRVCELYSSKQLNYCKSYIFVIGTMDEMQKSCLKSLVKKKKHSILTPLILTAIENLSHKEIAEKNINKSNDLRGEMIIE